ncbi:MAG: toxin-antitoxin system YwqK family antitoxin [Parachlamydiaceae bacterium]|nr:toxin-antitoxin system YwqK family antitoxin [Parachlamydiaceae bacterium]
MFVLKRSLILFLLLFALTGAKRSPKQYPKPIPLASIHIVDRNGFSETISNKDRLNQYQLVDFQKPQPYQKVLRVYARDSKGNVRSIVSSYHSNGNPKQFLEIVNGRALGSYREWHENGNMGVSAKVIGGMADITQVAEHSWLFDGISTAWDEDGHIIAEIPYSQGVLEGVAVYYHSNGNVWKRIPYIKGDVEGNTEIFKETGELLQQITYEHNSKHGPSLRFWEPNLVSSQEEFIEGKLDNAQYFDRKGVLLSEVKNGTGFRTTFGKESLYELQEYKYGIMEGVVKVYTPQGRLKRLYHVQNNQKHGEEFEYYDLLTDCSSSTPQSKISFAWYEGKIHGPMKTWYPNGNVECQREMSNNRKNGIATIWYRDGNLMMIEEYEQDKLVRGDYFRKGEKIPASQIVQGKGTVTTFDPEGRFVQKIPYVNGKPDE